MKKRWTDLIKSFVRTGLSNEYAEMKFNSLFCNHHRQACELVLDMSGQPMAAIYFTPIALKKREFKNILRYVQEETLYRNEMPKAASGEGEK